MHFKISDRMGKKQKENFLKRPPIFVKKLVYMRWIGGAFASAIENRFVRHRVAADGSKARRYKNSGGMWDGWESRISGRRVVLEFMRSSLPSYWALRAEKQFKDPKARKDWVKQMKKQGKAKRLPNKVKARSAQRHLKSREMAEPSRSEVNALLTWMETHVERNVFAIAASRYEKKPIPDRYNLILPKLPDPKTSK